MRCLIERGGGCPGNCVDCPSQFLNRKKSKPEEKSWPVVTFADSQLSVRTPDPAVKVVDPRNRTVSTP